MSTVQVGNEVDIRDLYVTGDVHIDGELYLGDDTIPYGYYMEKIVDTGESGLLNTSVQTNAALAFPKTTPILKMTLPQKGR